MKSGAIQAEALLRSEKIWFLTVAFLFLFDKHCPGSKDSSHKLHVNCEISFYFRLYLMFHICDQRFDVMGNLEKFCELKGLSFIVQSRAKGQVGPWMAELFFLRSG